MALIQDLENSGNWLFKYRSYLPLILLPVILYFLKASNPYDIDLFLFFIGLFSSFFGEMSLSDSWLKNLLTWGSDCKSKNIS